MVAVMEMAQLMDGDVIDNPGRGHHALPVKAQYPAAPAAGPAKPQILHFDTGNSYADFGRKEYSPCLKPLLPFICIELFKRFSGTLGAAALDDFSAQAETSVLQFQRPVLA